MDELFESMPAKKAYFQLALPLLMGLVATMIYNFANTFFIAQTQNTEMVAAVSLCAPIFTFFLAIGDMYGLGGSTVLSQYLGRKDRETSRKIASFCIYASIVTGILVTVIMLLLKREILTFFGANGQTYTYAEQYYLIVVIGAFIIISSMVPQNLLRSEGLANTSMLGTILGTIVTIVLDPIFIFVLKMGVAGVGLATVLGYTVTMAVYLRAIFTKCKVINVDMRLLALNVSFVKEVIMIGIPAAITNLMQSLGAIIMNKYLAIYGVDKVAAYGIVTPIYMIVALVMVGLAFGPQPLIGYSYGARNKERLKDILLLTFKIETVCAIFLTIIISFLAPYIFKVMFKNTEVITNATNLLRALLITSPLVGAIMIFTVYFQAVGKASAAFLMSICRQGIIFLIATMLLNSLIGYSGVVIAQPISDLITFTFGMIIFRKEYYKVKNM